MWCKSSKQRKAAVRREASIAAAKQAVLDQRAKDAGSRNCWLPPKKKRLVNKKVATQILREATTASKRPPKLIKAQKKRAAKARVVKAKAAK